MFIFLVYGFRNLRCEPSSAEIFYKYKATNINDQMKVSPKKIMIISVIISVVNLPLKLFQWQCGTNMIAYMLVN